MLIPVFNPETTDLEKSYLINPYSASITSIQVKNADRFNTNDRLMIGEMGLENTEVVTLSTVGSDNQTLTIGATLYPHSADDPVYKLRFDTVKFYKSTDGGLNYSLLSTQALDVDNADLQTFYDDTVGLPNSYYKFTFYHSISTYESDFSDVIKGSGWRRRQVGYIIDQVLQEIGDPQEQNIRRSEMLGYFNDVNDELTTQVQKPYSFLHTRSALTRTATQAYIDFPTNSDGEQTMWKFDYMDYNFTDSTTSPATNETSTIVVMPEKEFRNTYTDNTNDATTQSDTKPDRMALDTAVNRFRFSQPALTTAPNVFYLHYWKFFDTLGSEGDEIETLTPLIYKLYIKKEYFHKRALADPTLASDAQSYEQRYIQEKTRYKGIDRKDAGTPRGFRPRTDTYNTFVR